MNRLISKLWHFFADQSGVAAIEYGLMSALVSVVIIGAVTLLGDNLVDTFDAIAASLGGG